MLVFGGTGAATLTAFCRARALASRTDWSQLPRSCIGPLVDPGAGCRACATGSRLEVSLTKRLLSNQGSSEWRLLTVGFQFHAWAQLLR